MTGLARMFLPGGGGAQLVSFPPSTSYYLVPELFSLDNTTPLLPSRTESLVLSCSSITALQHYFHPGASDLLISHGPVAER